MNRAPLARRVVIIEPAAFVWSARTAFAEGPPQARVEPVTAQRFGVTVADNDRWMADRSAAPFAAWTRAENETRHQAGRLANESNGHRELGASAAYPEAWRFGSASTMAIERCGVGGMASTRRPEPYRVAFSGAGDANPLRSECGTDETADSGGSGSGVER